MLFSNTLKQGTLPLDLKKKNQYLQGCLGLDHGHCYHEVKGLVS